MAYDLPPKDTRVFLFHSPDAVANWREAMRDVNSWLDKDRSMTDYANLRVRDVQVTPDGQGGVFTTVICTLGTLKSGSVTSSRSRMVEEGE